MTRIILFLITIVLSMFFITLVQSKICFTHCSEDDPKLIRKIDIDGCRRRKSVTMPDKKRGLMNFKCDDGKSNNPPCTVLRGDTVYYDVEFAQDFPLKNLTTEINWINSWGFQLPLPGLDTVGCKYLQHKCKKDHVTENQIFSLPIKIITGYPPGSYNVRSTFTATKNGSEVQVGCVFYVLRIL